MTKIKNLYILIFILIGINAIILGVFIFKGKPKLKHRPPHITLIELLDFSLEQKQKVKEYKGHKKIRSSKKALQQMRIDLYSNIDKRGKSGAEIEKILREITKYQTVFEEESYAFFSFIRETCTTKQKEKFDKIILDTFKRPGMKEPFKNH